MTNIVTWKKTGHLTGLIWFFRTRTYLKTWIGKIGTNFIPNRQPFLIQNYKRYTMKCNQQMLKAIFIVLIKLPRLVSASKWHLQGATLPCKLLQFLVCVLGGCGLLFARCVHLLRNSQTPLRSSPDVSDQVSHPYTTTTKIIFLLNQLQTVHKRSKLKYANF